MNDLNNKKDEELVVLSLKEDSYFAFLVERYENKLARYIARLCNCSKEDIEDLLQEIFIKIYRNLNDFDRKLKFSSWAYRITHNEVISHHRKLQSRPQNADLNEELLSDKPSVKFGTLIDQKLDKIKIMDVLQLMDMKYRDALILRYFEEKDYAEISDILKKPSGTVATLLNRAKKQFKDKAKELNINF